MCCWEELKFFTGNFPVKALENFCTRSQDFVWETIEVTPAGAIRNWFSNHPQAGACQPSLTWLFAALGFRVAGLPPCSVTILVLSLELMRDRGCRVTGLRFTKSATGTLQCLCIKAALGKKMSCAQTGSWRTLTKEPGMWPGAVLKGTPACEARWAECNAVGLSMYAEMPLASTCGLGWEGSKCFFD